MGKTSGSKGNASPRPGPRSGAGSKASGSKGGSKGSKGKNDNGPHKDGMLGSENECSDKWGKDTSH